MSERTKKLITYFVLFLFSTFSYLRLRNYYSVNAWVTLSHRTSSESQHGLLFIFHQVFNNLFLSLLCIGLLCKYRSLL